MRAALLALILLAGCGVEARHHADAGPPHLTHPGPPPPVANVDAGDQGEDEP